MHDRQILFKCRKTVARGACDTESIKFFAVAVVADLQRPDARDVDQILNRRNASRARAREKRKTETNEIRRDL